MREGAGEDGPLESKSGPEVEPKVRRRACCLTGRGIGNAKHIFVPGRVGARLRAGGFPQLLTKPGGGIDLRVNRWRGGFVLGGAGAAIRIPIRDQAFDGDDANPRT